MRTACASASAAEVTSNPFSSIIDKEDENQEQNGAAEQEIVQVDAGVSSHVRFFRL